jgi:DNA-binding NarL/FixJ family response regulator
MIEQNPLNRILLVDDHQMFIDGIRVLLEKSKYKIIGEALNGTEALKFLETNEVDIVITDINMPGMSGCDLTKTIKKQNPNQKVIVLSMYNDREIIHEIIMSEAEGYILKNTGKQELLLALERINNGGTFYSNEVIEIITENYVTKQKAFENLKELSERELEIIKLICQEFSTPEIAGMLFISPLTVETHRKNILKKTKVRTIVGLIKFAIENGITKF